MPLTALNLLITDDEIVSSQIRSLFSFSSSHQGQWQEYYHPDFSLIFLTKSDYPARLAILGHVIARYSPAQLFIVSSHKEDKIVCANSIHCKDKVCYPDPPPLLPTRALHSKWFFATFQAASIFLGPHALLFILLPQILSYAEHKKLFYLLIHKEINLESQLRHYTSRLNVTVSERQKLLKLLRRYCAQKRIRNIPDLPSLEEVSYGDLVGLLTV